MAITIDDIDNLFREMDLQEKVEVMEKLMHRIKQDEAVNTACFSLLKANGKSLVYSTKLKKLV